MESKDLLMHQIAIKKIQTTMIGAISKFEDNFGHLWGHFSNDELSEEQEEFADLWDFTRNSILNQGNKQIRQLKDSHNTLFGKPKITNKYYFTDTNQDNNQKED